MSTHSLIMAGAANPPPPPDTPGNVLLHLDGNFTDIHGHNVTGTSVVFGTGKFGQAFASGGPINIDPSPDLLLNQDFTVEAWVFKNPSGSNHIMFSAGGSNTSFRLVHNVSTGLLDLYGFGNVPIAHSTITLPTSTWAHLAVAVHGSTYRIFINGENRTNLITTPNPPTQTTPLTFSPILNGNKIQMDEFRLTIGLSRYNSNFTPPTAPFTG